MAVALSSPCRADFRLIDFAAGEPPPSVAQISRLTPGTGLDFTNGMMNVAMPNPGDGVDIDPTDFNPNCVFFRGLSLQDFSTGQGVSFEMVFGASQDGNSAGVALVEGSGTTIKITETVGGVTTVLQTVVLTDTITNIKVVRIDWINRKQLQVEIFTANDLFTFARDTDLVHDPTHHSFYRMKNISGVVDTPLASMTQIELETVHVPEPSSLALLALGALSLAGYTWRRGGGRQRSEPE